MFTGFSCFLYRILVCRNEKNKRISLYSVFIDPSDTNYFAVSGRDQWARYVNRKEGGREGGGMCV